MLKTQVFPTPGSRGRGNALGVSGPVARRLGRLQGTSFASRILGVDPGLNITGYGLVQLSASNDSALQLIEGGVLKPKTSGTLPERLHTLHQSLTEVLREHKPDVVVIEELFSTYAHPRSALLLAQARGVLVLAAQQSGATVHSFTPNEVKQVVAGNGHATKSAMQSAVRTCLKLASAPHPADVADALALAICYAARQNLGAMTG